MQTYVPMTVCRGTSCVDHIRHLSFCCFWGLLAAFKASLSETVLQRVMWDCSSGVNTRKQTDAFLPHATSSASSSTDSSKKSSDDLRLWEDTLRPVAHRFAASFVARLVRTS